MKEKKISLSSAAVAILIGVALTGGGIYIEVTEITRVKTAEPVDATVTMSSNQARTSGGQYSSRIFYTVSVEFEYEFKGETYTSDNVIGGYRDTVRTETRADKISSEYSAGRTVTAYVPPNHPSKAYLIQPEGYPYLDLMHLLAIGVGMIPLWTGFKELFVRYSLNQE